LLDEEIYKFAWEVLGEKTQLLKCAEELGEEQHEIFKVIEGKPDLAKLAEEIGDVEITNYQIKNAYNLQELVEKYKRQKLQRFADKFIWSKTNGIFPLK